jgi:hypothetical protein
VPTIKKPRPRRQRASKEAPPLYLLEQLQEAVGNEQTIFIVGNEEAADALIAIGVPATTNGGGWHEEFNAHLRDADVVLVPNNTDGGWRVVNQIGISLRNVAKRTRFCCFLQNRLTGSMPGARANNSICS